MSLLKQFNEFHDWRIEGIRLNGLTFELLVHFEEVKKVIRFEGMSRCLVNGFTSQNIVYTIQIFSGKEVSETFSKALHLLDKAQARRGAEQKGLAVVTASAGAELVVEFSTLSVADI